MEDAYQQLTGRVVAGMATEHKQEPDPLFFLGVGSGQDYVATPTAHAHIQRKATPKCRQIAHGNPRVARAHNMSKSLFILWFMFLKG